ncbi:MAG: winged helix-turn-helix transcriptional regulator [Gracilimonas sp.]|uniref:ArsR/SmtB family transcription factor n=1 Tax=Gracilimonas TaxID=649462 RepID=UPI001B1BF0C0|nr:metalloregulator ArsR/SmtB family transcription factor [Gracilimonas sp.]MBO6585919.1 winged helix-turn-helix transcriptional regulator [Gracilimonas sp.]MBO6616916.1 winged helix-turn-helix transcriptional regulator [Gracilimonas sp.]
MALTKAQLFDEKQVKAAEFAKALAHPARIAILEILAKRNTCICGDITEELPLAQSTVSQHLKALKSAGIIKGEIDGVRTCYCLDEDNVAELKNVMESLLKDLTTQNPNCC